jgi:hypothetical protein
MSTRGHGIAIAIGMEIAIRRVVSRYTAWLCA